MKTSLPLILATLGITLYSAQTAASELNGIGRYTHMGKAYYWVSHYSTSSCHSVEQCLSSRTSKRFTLKVTTRRWTPHNFNLVWQRDLADNNNWRKNPEQAKALEPFMMMAKSPLTLGDTIEIYLAEGDTKVDVNGSTVLTLPSSDPFFAIARVWLGKVPPSRRFQQQLLIGHGGNHDNQALKAFEQTSVDPSRLALGKQWLALMAPQTQTETFSVKSELTAAPKTATQVLQTKAVEAPLTIAETPAPQKATQPPKAVPKPVDYQARITELFEQSIEYPNEALIEGQEGSIEVDFTINEAGQLEGIMFSPTSAPAFKATVLAAFNHQETLEAIPVEARNQQYFYQKTFRISEPQRQRIKDSKEATADYIELSQGLLNAIIEYPDWAKSLRHRGNVTVDIRVARDGTIVHHEVTKACRHKSLNQAIGKTLAQLESFTELPESIFEQEVPFSYTHHFQ